jgi:hypothetical protein
MLTLGTDGKQRMGRDCRAAVDFQKKGRLKISFNLRSGIDIYGWPNILYILIVTSTYRDFTLPALYISCCMFNLLHVFINLFCKRKYGMIVPEPSHSDRIKEKLCECNSSEELNRTAQHLT